ncbi:MAG: preprotein translocase subunit SecA [Myxococcales bacterium]|nr:preprotein translocase subunit SecA [Myxococcales bacterium]
MRSWWSRFLHPGSALSYKPLLLQVNAFEPKMQAMSAQELAGQTALFRARLEQGQPLLSLLPEAFATVREVGRRELGMRHFDVQILGGAALAHGGIAEMKTGEGKTLVATLPAYLYALQGKGVHVITVNDYLASRDAEWMGKIYRFLGLEVGVVLEDMGEGEKEIARRQTAYSADITYVTNHEVVFDYLRDHLATHPSELVQRAPHFAIVDEVDLLLIDEVRTPLIISGPAHEDVSLFADVDKIIRKLQIGPDLRFHPRTKTATLTESGQEKVEAALQRNLSDPDNLAWFHAVHQSVQAHGAFKRDVDYIVKGGEVQLIDEHTGRVSPDKRFSDGLHQALEAKERLRVQAEDRTFARMSYQQYFRLYPKLCGMTGTAASEKQEFSETYGLRVLAVPTNKTVQRKDYMDVIYASEREKHEAIASSIEDIHEEGQPILVGTTSVEESEQLVRLLKKRGLSCEVLNAKDHEREADVVAQAGRKGAITISTNMAGRGTDILLGGNVERLVALEEKKKGKKASAQEIEKQCEAERKAVIEAGGLFVIGTSLHDSPRLDNQLRGRAGRQGDPGASQFFVSFDDEIFAKYGEAEVAALQHDFEEHPEGEEIDNRSVRAMLYALRDKVTFEHRAERKETLKYDSVVHQQREQIYQWRQEILLEAVSPQEHRSQAREMILEVLEEQAFLAFDGLQPDEDLGPLFDEFEQVLQEIFRFPLEVPRLPESRDLADAVVAKIQEAVLAEFDRRFPFSSSEKEEAPSSKATESLPQALVEMQRTLLLESIDDAWIDHLGAIERLEDNVSLYGYAEQDPIVIFRRAAGVQFGELLAEIRLRVVSLWFALELEEVRPSREKSGSAEKKKKSEKEKPEKDEKKAKRDKHPLLHPSNRKRRKRKMA